MGRAVRAAFFMGANVRKTMGKSLFFCNLTAWGGGGAGGEGKIFSNHWKTGEKIFQSLEKWGGIFQPLENFFPIIGKNGRSFPIIGKFFSNGWKIGEPADWPKPGGMRGRSVEADGAAGGF
jgi:hypothetical protein